MEGTSTCEVQKGHLEQREDRGRIAREEVKDGMRNHIMYGWCISLNRAKGISYNVLDVVCERERRSRRTLRFLV